MATYKLIASTTLSTNGNISFTSIPSTYTDLVIRMTAQGSASGLNNDTFKLTFNASSAANYKYSSLFGNTTTVSATNSTGQTALVFKQIGAAGSGRYGIAEVYLSNYAASTAYKSMVVDAVAMDASNTVNLNILAINAGYWNSTSAINQIEIAPSTGNFVSGSTFSLYGIKNS